MCTQMKLSAVFLRLARVILVPLLMLGKYNQIESTISSNVHGRIEPVV